LKKIVFLIANSLSALVKLVIYLTAFLVGIAAFFMVYSTWGIEIGLLSLPVIALVLPFAVLIELFIFRILIPKPRLGVHKTGGGQHFLYQLNKRVFNVAVNPAFPPLAAFYKNSNVFRILTLKASGANVKFSSRIGFTTKIHDPFLFTVGSHATIDNDVQIFSFAKEIGKIILRRVFVGPKSHVGAASLIFPGTEIGEGSVLGMGSSTRNEMRIPQYELWVGNPASHLSKLTRPLLYTTSHSKDRTDRHGDKKPFQKKPRFGGRDRYDRGKDDYRERGRGGRGRRDNRGRGFSKDAGGYGDSRGPRDSRGSRGPRDSRSPRRDRQDDRSKSSSTKHFIYRPKQDETASKPEQQEQQVPTQRPEQQEQTPAPKPVIEKSSPDTYIGPLKKPETPQNQPSEPKTSEPQSDPQPEKPVNTEPSQAPEQTPESTENQ